MAKWLSLPDLQEPRAEPVANATWVVPDTSGESTTQAPSGTSGTPVTSAPGTDPGNPEQPVLIPDSLVPVSNPVARHEGIPFAVVPQFKVIDSQVILI